MQKNRNASADMVIRMPDEGRRSAPSANEDIEWTTSRVSAEPFCIRGRHRRRHFLGHGPLVSVALHSVSQREFLEVVIVHLWASRLIGELA